MLSLSGGKPKEPHKIKSLALELGPNYMTDIAQVETSDHARLSLKLSYNWHFELPDADDLAKIFCVPDFVGDCCKAVASRVRGCVAQTVSEKDSNFFFSFVKNNNPNCFGRLLINFIDTVPMLFARLCLAIRRALRNASPLSRII